MVFEDLSVIVLWAKVASALEGVNGLNCFALLAAAAEFPRHPPLILRCRGILARPT